MGGERWARERRQERACHQAEAHASAAALEIAAEAVRGFSALRTMVVAFVRSFVVVVPV